MRRIKNSVKAIIVSAVAVVCVLAIVLGCVFGLKRKGNPNNPKTQVDYSSLVSDINSANEKPTYEIFDSAPYASVDGCTAENLVDLGKNYFIYSDLEEKKHFFTYSGNGSTEYPYTCKELTKNVSDGGFIKDEAVDWEIEAYNDQFLIIKNFLNSEPTYGITTTYVVIFSVIEFDSTVSEKLYDIDFDYINGYPTEDIKLTENYLYFSYIDINRDLENSYNGEDTEPDLNNSRKPEIKFYDLNKRSDSNYNILTIDGFDYYTFGDLNFNVFGDGFIFIYQGKIQAGVYSNGVFVTKEKSYDGEQIDSASFYNLSLNKIFIEENYINSSKPNYVIYDYEKNDFINYSLHEGYFKASTELISPTANCYYIYEQKEDEAVQNPYLNIYFNKTGKELISYTSEQPEKILLLNKTFFLLDTGIYYNENNSLLMNFNGSQEIKVQKILGDSGLFIYESNGLLGIKNLAGDNVNENIYNEIYGLGEHYSLGVITENIDENEQDTYYKIDNSSGNATKIDNLYLDNNLEQVLLNGIGLYLTKDSEFYDVYFNGAQIFENKEIDNFEFYHNINKGIALSFYNKNKNIGILKLYYDGTIEFEDIGPVSKMSAVPFNSNSASNEDVSISVSDNYYWGGQWLFGPQTTEQRYTLTVTKQYYYPSTIRFRCNYSGNWYISVNIYMSRGENKVSSWYLYFYEKSDFTSLNNNGVSKTSATVTDGKIELKFYHYREHESPDEIYDITPTSWSGFPYYLTYHYNYSNDTTTNTNTTYGTEYNANKTISRTGYTFLGWYTDPTNGSQVEKFTCYGNKDVYAHWSANTYDIKYYDYVSGSGSSIYVSDFTGTMSNKPSQATYDQDFTVDLPTRTGYTFTNWRYIIKGGTLSSNRLANGTQYAYNTTTKNFKNIATSGTVYFLAQWEPNNFQIRYEFLHDGYGYEFTHEPGQVYGKRSNNGNVASDSNGVEVYTNGSLSIAQGRNVSKSVKDAFNYEAIANQTITNIFDVDSKNYITDAFSKNALHHDSYGYTKISIKPSYYQIVGWIIKANSGDTYYKVTNCNLTIGQVVDLSGAYSATDGRVINLYAIYEPRNYYVDVCWSNFGGSASLDQNADLNNKLLLNDYLNLSSVITTTDNHYPTITSQNHNVSSASNPYNVFYTRNVDFKFTCKYPSYIISRVELRYFPYKVSDNQYRKTTVTITLDWSVNNRYTISASGVAVGQKTDSEGNGYYYIGSTDEYNKISVTYSSDPNSGEAQVTITVKNVGYANSPLTSSSTGTDKYNNNPNENSVNSNGMYGFVVAPYVTSNYMKADEVTGSYVKENSGSVNVSPFANITPNTIYENGGYARYGAVPVNGSTSGTFWINGLSYTISGNQGTGFYTLSSGKISSSTSSNLTGTNVYYDRNQKLVYYNLDTFNYANTQIIAIAPQQKKIITSNNAVYVKQSGKYYELLNYLRAINFGGTTFTLEPASRNINDGTPYSYGNLQIPSIVSGGTVTKIQLGQTDTANEISYLGKTYIKTDGYILQARGNSIEYRLYIAYCAADNHVMYFLFSEYIQPTGKNTANNFTFQFADYNLNININSSLATSDDTYNGQNDDNLDIQYKVGSESYKALSGNVSGVKPQNTYIFAFRPNKGYLIYQISVRVGNSTLLYNFTLNKSGIGANYTANAPFQLVEEQSSSGTTSTNVLIMYNANTNKNLLAYRPSSATADFNNTTWGIYFSNQYPSSSNSNNLWGIAPAQFESFYLLVSGIYDDVSITLRTISYFEFDFLDRDNLLGLQQISNKDSLTDSDFDGVRLSMLGAVAGSNQLINHPLKDLVSKTADKSIFVKSVRLSDGNVLYRMIFFGAAKIFGGNIAIYSSDLTYSNYFNGFQFYGSTAKLSSLNIFDNSLNKPISQDIVYKDEYSNMIYFETGNGLLNFFEGYRNLNGFKYDDSRKQFVSDYKYTVIFNVNKNNTSITTKSYISNENLTPSGAATTDNVYMVSGSGAISNSTSINTSNYGKIVSKSLQSQRYNYQLDTSTSKVNSWFNDTILTNIDYKYSIDNSANRAEPQNYTTNWQNFADQIDPNDEGKVKLNNVSGYGIQIIYHTIPGYYLQYVDIYTPKTGWIYLQNSDFGEGKRVLTKSGTKCNVCVNIEFNQANFCYIIYLYDNENGNENPENKYNSLGVLAGELKVNLYAKANNIKINYHANVDSSSISTKNTLKLNGTANNGSSTGSLVYDSIQSLEYRYTMTGYSFIGWGSEMVEGANRFTEASTSASPNTWNSSSTWIDVTNLFKYNSRNELLNIAKKPTMNSYQSYDFYVAGGYFITDTGYKTNRGQIENYNFWAAYSNVFTLGLNTLRNSEYTYTIDLYGIWKANTYNVVLNLNDVNESNGSTVANVARLKGGTYPFDSTNYTGVINPGDLKYNQENSSNSQQVFVTFDTNDWYVIERNSSNKKVYSSDDYDTLSSVIKQSFRDYIIDRYGYTWLGWFGKQIRNYREGENNKNVDSGVVSVIVTSKYSVSGVDSAFPVLNYSNYSSLAAVKDDITEYFYVNNNKSVYNNRYVSKFVYQNQLGVFENGVDETNRNTYLYFYTYGQNAGQNKYNYAADYLNVFDSNGYSKNSFFTYFDTAIDYMSYKTDARDSKWFTDTSKIKYDSSVSVYEKINNYRSITLYAYWQTNLYSVEVDYRDVNTDQSAKSGIGSSAVTIDANKHFAPVFFDDDLTTRLNKFIPVRLGYDFIGWSFDPQISTGTTGVLVYQFVASASYKLDSSNVNYLFTTNAPRNLLRASDNEELGDTEGNHVVHLYAGWSTQEFSINVSLNISGEALDNLYRSDSEFAIGLYRNSFKDYTGIKQSFAMTQESGELKFVDIVANLQFKILFDQQLSTAVLSINGVEYGIEDLFATSAGYYLLGWLYNSTDTSNYFVENGLSTTFDIDGNVSNKLNQNDYIEGSSSIEDKLFDEELYNLLYCSFYSKDGSTNQALKDLDYTSVMELELNSKDNSQFNTFTSSSNKSTNFGIINGKYYLAVEVINNRYYMYYYDDAGTKQRVTPYISWSDGRGNEIANSESESNFTFDGSNFYYNGYIVYFENGSGYNAFYTTGNYGYNPSNAGASNVTRLSIVIVARNSLSDETVEKAPLTYTPLKTRQFTLFAHWQKKADLSVSVENGNAGSNTAEDTPQSNHGLAGMYDIWSTNEEGDTTENRDGGGNYEDGVEIEAFKFYENVNYVIYPFFNGRYLSEMQLTFYSYEDVGTAPTGFVTNYQKVTYLIVLKFKWDSANHTIVLQTENNRTRLERNGTVVNGINFTIDGSGKLKITGLSKLSNLDINAFENGVMQILNYNTKIPSYDRNNYYSDRQDLNAITIAMQNVKSSVEMVCSFSVQTFTAEFYNVFDETGQNDKEVGNGNPEEFFIDGINNMSDLFDSIDSARYANGVSTLSVALDPGDVINLSTTSYLPTIQTDSYLNNATYNVPYGTFIYGSNQSIRPDDAGKGKEAFGGYKYIFQGSYKYGSTTTGMRDIADQFSPLLGKPSSYVQSIQKPTTLYTFENWFETKTVDGSLVFDEYSSEDEETFISRDIILFGYYYANNKPTNIQFYTWSDSNQYTEYTQNIDEYTLQATTTNSAFVKSSSTKIIPGDSGENFVNNTTDNKAIILFSKSYGVDGVGFSYDRYSTAYIKNNELNKQFVNNTLIRNYWYYRYLNYYLYFGTENDRKYIRYDSNSRSFYYLDNEQNLSGTKHYINLYTLDLKDNTFVVYADLNPNSSGVNITNDNDLNYYIGNTGLLTRLMVDDTDYTYNFKGSEMYAKYNKNGEDRYYKIKDIRDYQSDTSLTPTEKTEISQLIPNSDQTNVSAKFYVKLDGKVYYFIVSNGISGGSNTSASDFYTYSSVTGAFTVDLSLRNLGVVVTTIDNYFFVVDDKYYQVEYTVTPDENGGYINPWENVNNCNIKFVSNSVEMALTVYFNYEDKNFYQNYNSITHEYSNKVTSDKIPGFKRYTPVNDNYSVEIELGDSNGLWEYRSVKINSLPDPTIGLWYGYGQQSKQYYGYIGYINMLESNIDYLVDLTLDGEDEEGRPSTDDSKQPNRDRIYDTIVKYIKRNFTGQPGVDLNSLFSQAKDYVKRYKSERLYLSNLITVSPSGFVYGEDSNIIEAVDVLITCTLTLNINGQDQTYYPTVKYRFNLITTNTSISENIYAIPIYCRNAIEFSSSSATTSGNGVNIDISKMTVQYFENIGNNYTHMYTTENGDFLRFALLTETQYNTMKTNSDIPSKLTDVLRDNEIVPVVQEVNSNMVKIPVPQTEENAVYYIVAYYNFSGYDYAIRVSDNFVKVSARGSSITLSVVY